MSDDKWIIGLSYGHHESSACALSSRGELIYIREEWLSRVKNDYRYPKLAINEIKNNIGENVAAIVHFQKPLKNWLGSGIKKSLSKDNYLAKINQFKEGDIFIRKNLKTNFKKLPNIYFCPHHLSHCLSSIPFIPNQNYSKNLHIVLDGYGDGISGGIFLQDKNDIICKKEFNPKSSLGLVYSAITEWANYKPNEDEFKVMALSAYGSNKYSKKILNEIILFNESTGDIEINQDYFNFEDLGISTLKPKFIETFGAYDPNINGKRNAHLNKNLCDVISSFQNAIEESVKNLVNFFYDKFKEIDYILLSGGLFHNSVLVGVMEDSKLEFSDKIIVSPSPGDAGSSLGACVFGAIKEFDKDIGFLSGKNSFIGPHLECPSTMPHLFEPLNVDPKSFILDLFKKGESIGTYGGRCEMGPRALGVRSMICDATNIESIENLNIKVKQREPFRPIAVIMSEESSCKVFTKDFTNSLTSEWMGKVSRMSVKMNFSHSDQSTRPQIIKKLSDLKDFQPVLYDLVMDGAVLGNTSFNIAGDPMVFSLEDLFINCIRMNLKFILVRDKIYKINYENIN